ncbi:hypothetical protein [Campylobacter suis]|uniref:Uncharacterized protein n=1 Tax=Campylobacter suis TaxID=2790657 RepID=A0ABM8Q5W5_9BACT|nr:hypothetical protein [Campylobacter suis]CAD7288280.1 hypothetical protein LMG8286_01248 [Campylobacter suis]
MIAFKKSREKWIKEILSMQQACRDMETILCDLDLLLQAYLQRKSTVCIDSRKKIAEALEILRELKG